jgi:hypothetical protein
MTRVPDSENLLILKYESDLSTCTTNIVRNGNELLCNFTNLNTTNFIMYEQRGWPLVCIKNEYTTISTCGLSDPTTVAKAAKAAKAAGARGRERGSGRGRGGVTAFRCRLGRVCPADRGPA